MIRHAKNNIFDQAMKVKERIEANNIEKIKAKNPFWNENGIMVKDPDGFGVIVSNFKVK